MDNHGIWVMIPQVRLDEYKIIVDSYKDVIDVYNSMWNLPYIIKIVYPVKNNYTFIYNLYIWLFLLLPVKMELFYKRYTLNKPKNKKWQIYWGQMMHRYI